MGGACALGFVGSVSRVWRCVVVSDRVLESR